LYFKFILCGFELRNRTVGKGGGEGETDRTGETGKKWESGVIDKDNKIKKRKKK
jgi:hypothetical protein